MPRWPTGQHSTRAPMYSKTAHSTSPVGWPFQSKIKSSWLTRYWPTCKCHFLKRITDMNPIKFDGVRGCVFALALCVAHSVFADTAALPGTHTLASKHSFSTLVSRVEADVAQQKMGLVATASASAGAAGRGIKIPGNTVLMVFRNDYAVRML